MRLCQRGDQPSPVSLLQAVIQENLHSTDILVFLQHCIAQLAVEPLDLTRRLIDIDHWSKELTPAMVHLLALVKFTNQAHVGGKLSLD